MIDAPLGLAFAAGMVATVNPCGFAMLPAYLAYFMGLEDAEDGRAGTAEALRVGGIVSLAFVSVFGVTGLLINAGLRSIIDWIPYLALAVGVVMLVLGVAMFRGYELNLRLLKTSGGGATRDNRSIFGFGVSYAVASLSCTLPVFLSVVVGSIATASFVSGLATYLAYGLGMSALLVAVTLALAFAKQGFVRRLRSMLRYVQRVSAGFLVVAGLYIIWFWIDDLSSDAGEQGRAAGGHPRDRCDRQVSDPHQALRRRGGSLGVQVEAALIYRDARRASCHLERTSRHGPHRRTGEADARPG